MATETIRETLTPEDVETKTFTPVRLREGYDMAEVDHFLDEVVATLRRAAADREAARREAVRTSPGLDGRSQGADGAAADGSGMNGVLHEAGSGRMSASEATSAAVRVLEMAQDEAEQIRQAAATGAEKVLADAQDRAALQEAHARAEADRLTAESQHRATELDEQTRARRAELFGALEAERARLANDVEGLRAFEREYRSRLRTYFTDQISRLDAERSPAAGLPGADGERGA